MIRKSKNAIKGPICHLSSWHIDPLIVLLFGFCLKETDKLIKISKNVVQFRIILLNYNGYVIVYFFISKN